MFNLKVIESMEEFEALKEEWNALLSSSNQDTFFLTWEWQFNWWKSFHGAGRLYIVSARDPEGKLSGIAPLYIKRCAFFNMVIRKELRFIGTGNEATSEYLDFICSAGREAELVKQFLHFISTQENECDTCIMEDIPEHSASAPAIEEYLKASSFYFFKEQESPFCPVIKLSTDWESYVQALPKLLRRNIRSALRKLESNYRVEMKVFDTLDTHNDAFDHFKRLYGSRRQTRRENNKYLRDDYTRFQKDILAAVSEKRWLYLCLLLLDGNVVAAQYHFRYGQKLYLYQMGSDERFAKLSLGQSLLSYVLQNAIGQKITECDMLRGDEWYKVRLSNEFRKEIRIVCAMKTLNGRMYVWLLTMRRGFFAYVRRVKTIIKMKPQEASVCLEK